MAKQKKNQKFGMPFFHTPKRKVIQGVEFHNEKLKTYYTPGQNPDVGESSKLYTTPTSHWQPNNRILYRPQTVWLNHATPYPFNTVWAREEIFKKVIARTPIYNFGTGVSGGVAAISQYVYGGSFYPNGKIFVQAVWNVPASPTAPPPTTPPSNDLGGWILATEPGIFPPRWTQTVGDNPVNDYLTNPYIDEYQRLLELFISVKEKIEKLRPDRTYIQIIDNWKYNAQSDINNVFPPSRANASFFGIKGTYFQFYDDGISTIHHDTLPLWETMAPVDSDDYFGVNFLHIYAGCSSNVLFIDQGQGDPRYPVIQNAFSKFCQYTVNMFGIDTFTEYEAQYTLPNLPTPPLKMIFPGFDFIPSPPLPPSPPGHIPDWKVYPPTSWPPGGDVGNYGAPWTSNPGVDSPTELNRLINGSNGSRDFININAINILKSEIAQLTTLEIDATYVGETSQINEDYLINLIAKHYNFNPITGKDLPIDKNKVNTAKNI